MVVVVVVVVVVVAVVVAVLVVTHTIAKPSKTFTNKYNHDNDNNMDCSQANVNISTNHEPHSACTKKQRHPWVTTNYCECVIARVRTRCNAPYCAHSLCVSREIMLVRVCT